MLRYVPARALFMHSPLSGSHHPPLCLLRSRLVCCFTRAVGDVQEPGPVWLCLTCAYAGCGQRDELQHALHHFESKGHPIAMAPETMQCWCYVCDDEVLNDDDMLDECRAIFYSIMRDAEDEEPSFTPGGDDAGAGAGAEDAPRSQPSGKAVQVGRPRCTSRTLACGLIVKTLLLVLLLLGTCHLPPCRCLCSAEGPAQLGQYVLLQQHHAEPRGPRAAVGLLLRRPHQPGARGPRHISAAAVYQGLPWPRGRCCHQRRPRWPQPWWRGVQPQRLVQRRVPHRPSLQGVRTRCLHCTC